VKRAAAEFCVNGQRRVGGFLQLNLTTRQQFTLRSPDQVSFLL